MVKANRGPRFIFNTNLAIRVCHPELVFLGDSVDTSDISKNTAALASETNVNMVSQELDFLRISLLKPKANMQRFKIVEMFDSAPVLGFGFGIFIPFFTWMCTTMSLGKSATQSIVTPFTFGDASSLILNPAFHISYYLQIFSVTVSAVSLLAIYPPVKRKLMDLRDKIRDLRIETDSPLVFIHPNEVNKEADYFKCY